ncbi:hypothetical protein HWHPT5561_00165 [Petrotoga sp. HWH.PT.55.6.1]|uniref:hypothetical protein n=1 Tax=unclassified Petrotoga TaxID=2620614 RepID=UPI000CA07901|nr:MULTISPECIES: hypothetical protein [unclassified Petrotoga]PNR93327.1 hypothetical protein X926_03470 [Petrotoga sp. HWHPT.55.6.3]RPD36691.1 hypothetical protein HWHPT5561_00165 [Petrotoga sp. HWH.PT.55.6.1]
MKKKWLVVMLVSFLSIFVLFGCLPTQQEEEPEEQPEETVMLKVYLPTTTPEASPIYLMGSYNGWDITSAATSEVKVDGEQLYAEFDISTLFDDEDYPVKYKYTCDVPWDFVEVNESGGDIGDRRLEVAPQSDVEDVVLNWKGMEPIDYSALQEEITVNFVVHVPEGTEGDAIYMRGWNGDWDNSLTLNKDSTTGYFTTEATTTSYTAQGYKFLRMDNMDDNPDDDWAYVEKDANGNNIGNRTYVLTDDATIVNFVESWAQ